MAIGPRQRRVILHLHQGAAERGDHPCGGGTRADAGVALHGVFVQDEALSELAALPFVREFRLGTGAWQQLDRPPLAEEQRAAAARGSTAARRSRQPLWVSRGCSRSSAATLRCSSPPARKPATSSWWRSRACRRSAWSTPRARWLEAAHGCAASVMLVPQVTVRRAARWRRWCVRNRIPLSASPRGSPPRRASRCCCWFGARSELARAATEAARAAGLPQHRVTTRRIRGVAPEDVVQGLGTSGERLVVLARGVCGADDAAVSAHIAASRGVPVLVAEG